MSPCHSIARLGTIFRWGWTRKSNEASLNACEQSDVTPYNGKCLARVNVRGKGVSKTSHKRDAPPWAMMGKHWMKQWKFGLRNAEQRTEEPREEQTESRLVANEDGKRFDQSIA